MSSPKKKMTSPKPKAKSIKVKASDSGAPKLSVVSSTSSKETIYVDVDDEITAIIDKVTSAKGTIIALVLPKRASVLQSVVNMRLLKRTAETAGKNLVLVTTEAGLLPLAGLVGLHVADTPSSRPVIPPMPDQPSEEPESVEESLDINDNSGAADDDFDPEAEGNTPVGELAGVAAVGAVAGAAAANAVDEEVELDDETPEDTQAAADVTPVKKNKKLNVPNFDKFRTRLALIIFGVILLIVGWVVASKVLPKATITIQTNSEVVKTSLNVTLDTNAKAVDTENDIIPAVAQSMSKTYSQQVTTTGQQNNGVKATGTVTLEESVCSFPVKKPADIPTGSAVSSNGRTYITQENASFANPQLNGSGTCFVYTTDPISITALKAGTAYNTSASADFTGPNGSTGSGSATGGTDNIIQVVSQADIDNAQSKITAQDTTQVKQSLESSLKAKGLMPVPSTFLAGDQQVTTSAKAGDPATSVTVTAVVPYNMLGIKEADLKQLVVANVNQQIDTNKQVILDDGVTAATFTQQSPATTTSAVVSVKVASVAGPDLNADEIKKQVAGKQAGDIKSLIGSQPGVTDVQVDFSPFWVNKAPTNTDKITVVIAKPSK